MTERRLRKKVRDYGRSLLCSENSRGEQRRRRRNKAKKGIIPSSTLTRTLCIRIPGNNVPHVYFQI